MTSDDLEKLWMDKKNWRGGLIYYTREDPRVIVPKRIRWTGYTMNFAHASAIPVLIAIVLVILLPFLLIFVNQGPQNVFVMMVAFFGITATITLLCHWESTRER